MMFGDEDLVFQSCLGESECELGHRHKSEHFDLVMFSLRSKSELEKQR